MTLYSNGFPTSRPVPSSLAGQNGMILMIALGLIAVIMLVGTGALLMTTTDIKISGSYRTSEKAFYNAKAGIEEARQRLKGNTSTSNYAGDPASSPDTWWSAYILTSASWQTSDDPDYDSNYTNYFPSGTTFDCTTIAANSLQSSQTYFVNIRHKHEYDAEISGHTLTDHYYDGDGSTGTHTQASPGNIIYYGYGDPAHPTTALQFTTSAATPHDPVNIITAYGTDGKAMKVIKAEVVQHPGPVIRATVYAKGDITGNGTALYVDGTDNCASASASLPPVYTLSPSITNLNGTPTMLGDPPSPQTGTDNIDIAGYVSSMKNSANVIITSDTNGASYGSSGDMVTCYSDTSNPYNVGGLKLDNVTGYGVLLVNGDLTLGGGFNWNGLILCTGVLVFNGGGAGINIRGAVLADQTVDLNGGIDVRYDSCMIKDSVSGQSMKIINWKEIS